MVNLKNLTLLSLLATIWSSSFIFTKLGVEEMPSLAFTAMRLWIAAAAFVIVYAVLGRSLLPSKPMPYIWVALFGSVLPLSLVGWGESRAPSDDAAIVIGAIPCFAMLLDGWFGGERITRRRLLGIGIGFLGVLTLLDGESNLLSTPAFLVAALCYAAVAVYGRRLTATHRLEDIVAFSTIFAALMVTVPVLLIPGLIPSSPPGTQAVAAAAVLGLGHTALAGMLFFYLLKTCGVTITTFCNYAVPSLGAFWGWALLGEHLGLAHLAALGLVLVGLAVIHKPPSRLSGKST